MCIKYCDLNSKTVKNRYALPSPHQIMDKVQGKKWFSAFDMQAGYKLV